MLTSLLSLWRTIAVVDPHWYVYFQFCSKRRGTRSEHSSSGRSTHRLETSRSASDSLSESECCNTTYHWCCGKATAAVWTTWSPAACSALRPAHETISSFWLAQLRAAVPRSVLHLQPAWGWRTRLRIHSVHFSLKKQGLYFSLHCGLVVRALPLRFEEKVVGSTPGHSAFR